MGFVILLLFCLLVWIAARSASSGDKPGKTPALFLPRQRRAGLAGERRARELIRSVRREGDLLFANVEIEYEGKPAELDFAVVNRCGVFIIEVKNYVGFLEGEEDGYEWIKYKTTPAGKTYSGTVKNPIRQVKRQIYLLSGFLKERGARVWVEGYALLLQTNSPVESGRLLNGTPEIDRAIHTEGRRPLDRDAIASVAAILRACGEEIM